LNSYAYNFLGRQGIRVQLCGRNKGLGLGVESLSLFHPNMKLKKERERERERKSSPWFRGSAE
jgi:hypothetical protein